MVITNLLCSFCMSRSGHLLGKNPSMYFFPSLQQRHSLIFIVIQFWAFRRIAVRQDTCAMVAISLNIQQRVHPIIWSVSNLPFDCVQAVPVKKPLGGTLIMAVNSLIYLNQSIPPYGVSLNALTDASTNFPLSKYKKSFYRFSIRFQRKFHKNSILKLFSSE